jgi:hypothetical protein
MVGTGWQTNWQTGGKNSPNANKTKLFSFRVKEVRYHCAKRATSRVTLRKSDRCRKDKV